MVILFIKITFTMRIFFLFLLIIPSISFSQNLYMGLTIEPEHTSDLYDRNMYGGWIDADSDGENTRAEVLKDESIAVDVWWGAYTGKIYTTADNLDIDHMVPLKEAHESGGHNWTREQRRAYANDLANPQHLIAVFSGANRSKGAQEPSTWMPPNRAYWCQYLNNWIQIKLNYSLSIDQLEKDALEKGLQVCDLYRIRDHINGRH